MPVLLIAVLILAMKEPKRLSNNKIIDSWQPLFNGKDFNDWNLFTKNGDTTAMTKVFCIDEDEVLHFFRDLPDGYALEDHNALHGTMITKRSYSKYILQFEYKWGKKLVNNFKRLQYDSGLYFHISEASAYPLGIQYQIRYNHLNDISYVAEIRGKFNRDWYSKDGLFSMPSKGGMLMATSNGLNLPAADAYAHGLDNQWNTCEIIVMDNEYVIFKLNGKVVNMVTNLSWSSGFIGLEAETGEIFWRNIRIKEYKKRIPKEVFLK